jgi:type IV secretory pathway protease TraF
VAEQRLGERRVDAAIFDPGQAQVFAADERGAIRSDTALLRHLGAVDIAPFAAALAAQPADLLLPRE